MNQSPEILKITKKSWLATSFYPILTRTGINLNQDAPNQADKTMSYNFSYTQFYTKIYRCMRIILNSCFITKAHSREKQHEIYGDSRENRLNKKIINFYKNPSFTHALAYMRTCTNCVISPLESSLLKTNSTYYGNRLIRLNSDFKACLLLNKLDRCLQLLGVLNHLSRIPIFFGELSMTVLTSEINTHGRRVFR